MIVLIAYDVASNRRRLQISKLLAGFGERVQYSVFECELTAERYALVRERLAGLANAKQDRVHFYPICRGCFGRAETIGAAYVEPILG